MTEPRDVYDIDALAKEAGLKVYDTALPIQWCDDVKAKTGKWPYGFVWCYDAPTVIWGRPVALTDSAKTILKAYEERRIVEDAL